MFIWIWGFGNEHYQFCKMVPHRFQLTISNVHLVRFAGNQSALTLENGNSILKLTFR